MQPFSVDRIASVRPVAAESASLATGKVLPVAPVNPASYRPVVSQEVPPTPSVINLVNQADKPNAGEGALASVSDPNQVGSDAQTGQKDWTVKRPAPEQQKTQDPPPEPISKMLIEHLRSLWLASASAVQVQEQVRDQLDPNKVGQPQAPAVFDNGPLVYSPTRIPRTGKTRN